MDILRKKALSTLINCDSTEEKIAFLSKNKSLLKNVSVILFDEGKSNFKKFDEKIFDKYRLCSLGDYSKTWILDSESIHEIKLEVGRKIYFDINVISRIDDFVRGKNVHDVNELVEFLEYVKETGFSLDIGNAMIERFSKEYDEEKLKGSIESFLKFAKNDWVTRKICEINIPSSELNAMYEKCMNFGLTNAHNKNILRQYNFILCLVAKAILIKSDNNVSNKIDALIRFSIDVLKCAMVNELYVLCLYLRKDQRVNKLFAKFHSNHNKGIRKAVENTTWDLYHSRIIEQNVPLYDNETHKVLLPYFATNDNGLSDYWAINPRKMIVLDNGNTTSVFQHNVSEMIFDKELLERIFSSEEKQKRSNELESVNIDKIKDGLLTQLDEVKI